MSVRLRYIGVVLVCGLLVWLFLQRSNGAESITYQTTPAKLGDIEAVVAAVGTLSPRNSVEVGAQVSGQIVDLAVAPGDGISDGQLLVEIDASLQQATVDAGRAELAAQQAQLQSRQAEAKLAEQTYRRQQQLAERSATHAQDVETAYANWQIAQASITELKALIDQTLSRLKGDEAQLGYTRIYAPMDGTVLSVDAKKGQTLNATYSTPAVMTVADLSRMTVEAKVAEADIQAIRPGMPVWFTTLGNTTRRWHGQVRQILPAPLDNAENPNIVHYPVQFDVANDDEVLMSGMTVQVSFVTEQAEDVLLVPLQALHPVEMERGAYRVQVKAPDNSVHWRDIQIGRQDTWSAEVIDGLQAGELVVTGERGLSKGNT